jgi:Flp pilus assembly protein TadD
LRAHAKWVFVFLALVFAVSFVFFGVGSGSTGISDALQNAFNFGGGGGTSLSKLQKQVDKHPQDATAWRNLATAYEQKHRTSDAIGALERYTALQPKDQSALAELASEYGTLGDTYRTQAQSAAIAEQEATPASAFAPPAGSPFGRAFNDPASLKDPIGAAVQAQASTAYSQALGSLTGVESKAEDVYKKLAKLNPGDASTQIQLGQAAQSAQDTTTAVAAYKKFLKLAPTDPLAAQVRLVLKQLEPAPAATKKTSHG